MIILLKIAFFEKKLVLLILLGTIGISVILKGRMKFLKTAIFKDKTNFLYLAVLEMFAVCNVLR